MNTKRHQTTGPSSSTRGNGQGAHPSHEAIEKKAYELWIEHGRKSGRELEYWLEAERYLNQTARQHRVS